MPLKIQEKIPLKKYTTFEIGGKADYFFVAKSKEEMKKILKWATEKKIPFFILGGGSKILFSDKGFRGLVIKCQNRKYKIKNKKILAESGCPLNELIKESLKRGLSGLEWAIGIPNITVGGAIRGNAGAFGKEMKDVVEKVKVLELSNCRLRIKELKNKECKFGYRSSLFKEKKNLIILEAKLKLKKENKKKLKEIIKKNLEYRKNHHSLEYPSAGSVFKNIPLKKLPKRVIKIFEDKIKKDPYPLLPAAVLISAAGLAGKKVGGAKVSEKHSNFIINFKKAKAKDVFNLICLIKNKIKEKFKVALEEEIELVGF